MCDLPFYLKIKLNSVFIDLKKQKKCLNNEDTDECFTRHMQLFNYRNCKHSFSKTDRFFKIEASFFQPFTKKETNKISIALKPKI